MNTPDKQQLLRDTLENADYQQFRARLRQRVLVDYRHRTASRRPAWFLALAACLAVSLIVLRLQRPDPAQPSHPTVFAGVIRTVPLQPDQRLNSVASTAVLVTTTNPNSPPSSPSAPFSIVRTIETAPNLLYLSDQELLALFPGKPVGLISTLDHTRLLVFVNPDDALTYGNPIPPGSIP